MPSLQDTSLDLVLIGKRCTDTPLSLRVSVPTYITGDQICQISKHAIRFFHGTQMVLTLPVLIIRATSRYEVQTENVSELRRVDRGVRRM